MLTRYKAIFLLLGVAAAREAPVADLDSAVCLPGFVGQSDEEPPPFTYLFVNHATTPCTELRLLTFSVSRCDKIDVSPLIVLTLFLHWSLA